MSPLCRERVGLSEPGPKPQLGARFLPGPRAPGLRLLGGGHPEAGARDQPPGPRREGPESPRPAPHWAAGVPLCGPGSPPSCWGPSLATYGHAWCSWCLSFSVCEWTVTWFSASRCGRAVGAFRFAALGTGVSTCRVTRPRTVSWHWHVGLGAAAGSAREAAQSRSDRPAAPIWEAAACLPQRPPAGGRDGAEGPAAGWSLSLLLASSAPGPQHARSWGGSGEPPLRPVSGPRCCCPRRKPLHSQRRRLRGRYGAAPGAAELVGGPRGRGAGMGTLTGDPHGSRGREALR